MFKIFSYNRYSIINNINARISTSLKAQYLDINNMNPNIKQLEYAVRGPIVIRAQELESQLLNGAKLPFSEVIKCNIGDCHATGQKPLTFLRQVVALVCFPELMTDSRFPADAIDRAKRVLDSCGGSSVGAYSQSTGLDIVRRDVATFISKRDGLECDFENVFLSTGASEAVKVVLQMMATQQPGKQRAGIMVPIPQYPLYSATNAEYNAYQIGYFLNESDNWGMSEAELERSLGEARQHCVPRAIVVINPGNPTGQVLSPDDIRMVIRFAARHDLLILADEVYQFNVYAPDRAFLSFKRALHELGPPHRDTVQVASFMSSSKGFMGECGFRGGYCELVNVPGDVRAQLYKCLSARLCSSVVGQALLEAIVNPPAPGDPSHRAFETERTQVLRDLDAKGRLVTDTLNAMPGFRCNAVQGAMYAFPRLDLPPAAIAAAQKANQVPDFFYCLNLLEQTGVCVVPGSGFGQQPGTFHFRTTILPPVDKMKVVMDRIKHFHTGFMKKYQ